MASPGYYEELKIIRRKRWNAFAPMEGLTRLTTPVTHVYTIVTGGQGCDYDTACEDSLRRIQYSQMTSHNLPDIKYNFMIGNDIQGVYEGRGWEIQPDLPVKHAGDNKHSLLIGIVGEYTEYYIPGNIVEDRQKLIDFGIKNNYIDPNFKAVDIFYSPTTMDLYA